jgi:hypothetical protein
MIDWVQRLRGKPDISSKVKLVSTIATLRASAGRERLTALVHDPALGKLR